ncbi:hypothetical protein S7711_07841 [Stachybotrys chartarum IBT 7711]|uniref:Uncharacterized protein n=1 Tax=Stachybotrys chartarum (strain CBS 109288 / IBT 7711) TaxID=1280523 RepID=A0A084AXM5_STACB|nr:hypothetical protein S7711_07841 [Stachybotrys chartarum IBT 7711]
MRIDTAARSFRRLHLLSHPLPQTPVQRPPPRPLRHHLQAPRRPVGTARPRHAVHGDRHPARRVDLAPPRRRQLAVALPRRVVHQHHRDAPVQPGVAPRQLRKVLLLDVGPARRRRPRQHHVRQPRQRRNVPPQPVVVERRLEQRQPPQLRPQPPHVRLAARQAQRRVVAQAHELLQVLELLEPLPQLFLDVEVVVEHVQAAERHVHHQPPQRPARLAEQLPNPHGRGQIIQGSTKGLEVERRHVPQRRYRGQRRHQPRHAEQHVRQASAGLEVHASPAKQPGRGLVRCARDPSQREQRPHRAVRGRHDGFGVGW